MSYYISRDYHLTLLKHTCEVLLAFSFKAADTEHFHEVGRDVACVRFKIQCVYLYHSAPVAATIGIGAVCKAGSLYVGMPFQAVEYLAAYVSNVHMVVFLCLLCIIFYQEAVLYVGAHRPYVQCRAGVNEIQHIPQHHADYQQFHCQPQIAAPLVAHLREYLLAHT